MVQIEGVQIAFSHSHYILRFPETATSGGSPTRRKCFVKWTIVVYGLQVIGKGQANIRDCWLKEISKLKKPKLSVRRTFCRSFCERIGYVVDIQTAEFMH